MKLRPSRIAAVAIIVTLTTAIANCSQTLFGMLNAPAYVGAYQRHADIPYGTGPRQSLDVYEPFGARSARRPVVVFWYGGTWTKGSKEQYRFVGAALASSGYVAILPDYRLYPQAHFPQFVEDGARAVKWAHEHAAEFGGDANALFIMGHSAGAHIAAILALDRRYLRAVGGDTEWVRGWIGLSGPYALDTGIPGVPILRAIFRAPGVAADWQAIGLVEAHAPRTLLIHGTADLFPRDVVALDQKLRAAGNHVECHIYPGTSHMTTVAAFSLPLRVGASSLADVREFIDRSVAVAGASHTPDSNRPCPELHLGRDTFLAGGTRALVPSGAGIDAQAAAP